MKKSKEKKVGLYGGTFDPLHFGHINLAIEIQEAHQLDEIWFCPARLNPHKQESLAPVGADHRYKMLQLALEDIPNFHAIDVELTRDSPSYTVDTLRTLIDIEQKSASPRKIYLIIGDDAAQSFFLWHQPEEIIRLAPVLIGRRLVTAMAPLTGDTAICKVLNEGMTPTHCIEISSTEIRQRLAKRQYCGHLVPAKVLDYIYQNHLYFNPGDKKDIEN